MLWLEKVVDCASRMYAAWLGICLSLFILPDLVLCSSEAANSTCFLVPTLSHPGRELPAGLVAEGANLC